MGNVRLRLKVSFIKSEVISTVKYNMYKVISLGVFNVLMWNISPKTSLFL